MWNYIFPIHVTIEPWNMCYYTWYVVTLIILSDCLKGLVLSLPSSHLLKWQLLRGAYSH